MMILRRPTCRVACMLAVGLLSLASAPFLACSGSPGREVSTSDCATLGTDAVALNFDDQQEVSASAVTSACEEVVVYTDPDAETAEPLKKVAISFTQNGVTETTVLEFASSGVPVAIRTTDDDATISLDEEISAARINVEGQNSSSGTFAVDRSTLARAQRRTQQVNRITDRAALCDRLATTDAIFDAVAAACNGSNPPAFCGSSVDRSAAAVQRLCGAAEVVEASQITDRRLPNLQDELGESLKSLKVDGFPETRAAAGGGTSIFLTSIPYGGTPERTVTWTQIDGGSVTLKNLQGNAALADAPTTSGRFTFRATTTDAAGDTATDDVIVDLDIEPSVVIQISNRTPATAGQVTTFAAAGTALPGNTTYLWSFGDGTNGQGQTVTHTYQQAGRFSVGLFATFTGGDAVDTDEVIVGGGDAGPGPGEFSGTCGTVNEGDFIVDILTGSSDFLNVGEQRQLSIDTQGSFGQIAVVWGVLEGPGSLADNSASGPSDLVFSQTPTLTASAEGLISVGVLAVDSLGQAGTATRAIPVFGGAGGLHAAINGPLLLEIGEVGTLSACVAGGDGNFNFTWRAVDDPSCIAGRSAAIEDTRAASTRLSVAEPGCAQVDLTVQDSSGKSDSSRFFIQVLPAGFGSLEVEFRGPFNVAVGASVPLKGFVAGAQGQVLCTWGIIDSASVVGTIDNQFSCDATFLASATGCTDLLLSVTDMAGNSGQVEFEICAGGDTGFDCPFDGFCDGSCVGFDPDCDDPCPLDGECDLGCPILDPDCFESLFCVAGDFFCDQGFCPPGAFDPDCNLCGPGDGCVELCFPPDPDCGQGACPFDFFCDLSCTFDPDCQQAPSCSANGFCNPECFFSNALGADPDCTNGQICAASGGITAGGFCCTPDSFCDAGCPTPDPECSGSLNCSADGACNPSCAADPDCGLCAADFFCESECYFDPDLTPDPDCTNANICFLEDFCCDADGFCDDGCPTTDVDCSNFLICANAGLCCDFDGFCDANCPQPDLDCF